MRMLWLIYGDVVAQLWGSIMGMWWLNYGDVVAQLWGCSLTYEDVVAHMRM
jgi:hypothetical protein